MTLLLAAREALVDGALEKAPVHLYELEFLSDQTEKVNGVHLLLAAMFADFVEAIAQKVGRVYSRYLHRVLEGEEDAFAGALFGGQLK